MFIVEGNIGAGKTTFLSLLKKHRPEYYVSLEPLHHWFSDKEASLLHNFYKDPYRWSYTMESVAMVSRVREYVKDITNTTEHPLIVERSVYSGHYGFALNGYLQGYMTDVEWSAYEKLFNYLVIEKCKQPTGFIYLRLDPAIAYERVQKRNRSGESSISLDYLKQLHERHEELLIHHSVASFLTSPVLILDCSTEFENDTHLFNRHLESVDAFIRNTTQR
jgi:deoxyadenosine/deoxycytidine kinase